jgi:hypothetical protein
MEKTIESIYKGILDGNQQLVAQQGYGCAQSRAVARGYLEG